MATTKIAYASSTSITITAGSLAAGSARESAAIDNTSNLYLNAFVMVQATLSAGSPSADKLVHIFAAGSEDGSSWTDNATGSDAGLTLRSPTNLVPIGYISTPDSGALLYKSHPLYVGRAFGGLLPRKWSIVVYNNTGLNFSAFTATYTGITTTTA